MSCFKAIHVGLVLLSFCFVVPAFPFLAGQPLSSFSERAKRQTTETTWSPSQLVDVTGKHAFAAPTAGQARGPSPGQNALANHGYIDHSGFTTLTECTEANVLVYNFRPEFAVALCFMAQFTGGNLLGLTWTIGNDSSVDSSTIEACRAILPLEVVDPLISLAVCGYLNPITDHALGTPGSDLAQTVNSFEGPHSMFQWDWGTANNEDASTVDMKAFQDFRNRALSNGTFDDYSIFTAHHARRWQNSVATNPCFLNAPFSDVIAAPGGHSFAYRMMANHTPTHPDGTLSKETFASWVSVGINKDGSIYGKGMGYEQIPNNWYRRSQPYTLSYFLGVDYPPLVRAEPRTLDIGGNTNGVNTYTGLDIGNLTSGVYNSKNFLQGDSFACFYYRLLQANVNWELGNEVGGALLTLGDTLSDVLAAVFGNLTSTGSVMGCPTFPNNTMHSYTQYCGVANHPGAIY